MVNALIEELHKQTHFLSDEVNSIYLGGGTPSLLDKRDLEQLFECIYKQYPIASFPEITLEANPDDLSKEYLHTLSQTPINRLSIGIQSFYDEDLQYMNRAHHANDATNAILWAQEYGFKNLNIDLIYGVPKQSHNQWKENLHQAFKLEVPHISAYALTVESGTALSHFINRGKREPVSEEHSATQFKILVEECQKEGFEHYEISNFSKKGFHSRHNSSYWTGDHYLGIGPSAHSFNGSERRWNISNNVKYLQAIKEKKSHFEYETLTLAEQYNEKIMLGLRCSWGVSINSLKNIFPREWIEHSLRMAQPYIQQQRLLFNQQTLQLSPSGKFYADGIASDLFWIDNSL